MSSFRWGSDLSYQGYLQAKQFMGESKSAARDGRQRVSLSVSRQTREIVASREALDRENIAVQEAMSTEITGSINEGRERLSYALQEISSGISELNATFHWGFSNIIAKTGHMNDSLSELIAIARTPLHTEAFNHFAIARNAFWQGLYGEALEELDRAFLGDHTSSGYKLEWRFHYLQGVIRLGFSDCDMTLVDLGKAEEAFLDAARYARKDYAQDAGRAFLSAGWAAYCQGKMAEALAHTEEAISVHSGLGEAVFQASKVLMAMDEPARALPLLRKAIDRDWFYALKAAGDGDFQKRERALREFLMILRRGKYRQALPEVEKALDTISGYRLSAPLSDLKNRLILFRTEGVSWPLMDILELMNEWRQSFYGIVTRELPSVTIQMEIETEEQGERQEKTIIRRAGLFRRKKFREETRTPGVPRKEMLNKTVEIIRDEWIRAIGGSTDCTWEFCLIPAGSFMMGDKDSRHKVTLTRDFYLGRYPVTQRQWEALMGDNPSKFPGEDRPVECVSWEDVQQYIQKLNALTGEMRYRLPTEAEWEYACRAGSHGEYCFGDQESLLGEYAWYDDNSNKETHPVGLRKQNGWGLYDMHGNVWEWVQDWYGNYPAGSATDPEGPPSGSVRVYRGGSWFSQAKRCRAAVRLNRVPGFRDSGLGFRLLRTR